MHFNFKKLLPHLIILVLFLITALAYFHPVLKGQAIFQSDIAQYNGMAKQQNDFRKTTGEETYWTNSAFGGMPTYQLGARYPHNYIKKLDLTLRFLPRPADYLFLYFIGIYILFLILKIDYKLAFLGALAFGFSTYLIIILGVGHNAKAHAIAYMPLVLGGIFRTFQGKYLQGFLLTTVAMALELVANHFQMTYYLLLLVICIGVVYLIDAFRKKMLLHYFKAIGVMSLAVVLSLGLNATNLLATQEYAKESTRSVNDITISPDGTPKVATSGLDYDYITEYSYGLAESFNLFIPGFMGGGTSDDFPKESEAKLELMDLGASPQEVNEIMRQIPLYWGDQPIVAAPAYVGAIIIFLSVLALFLVRGRLKWWIVAGFLLSLSLSWGRNFSFLTELFIDYVPLYNKFRAVSSIQVIIELILPILAVVGLHQFFNDFQQKEKKKKALLYASSISAGIALLFLLLKSYLFDFASPYDADIIEQLGVPFMDAVREDRMAVIQSDTLRSLIFVLLAALVLWLVISEKIKETYAIAGLAILVLIDLGGVDKRYVNADSFVPARIMEQPFQATAADQEIMQDPGHFRVYDITTNPFSSGRASFYHNALGGYHAAKLKRIQNISDFYLEQGDPNVLNMFNVKYFLVPNQEGGTSVQPNPFANGNAWFVENVIPVSSSNEELRNLDSLDTKTTAVIHKDFIDQIPTAAVQRDSTASIVLTAHRPNQLSYQSKSATDQLAVFSEMYYPHGWEVTIDGKKASFFRANYALRAMVVPAGEHAVEFTFEPAVIKKGSTISLMSSVLLLLLLVGGLVYPKFKKPAAQS